ncbi:putative non-reducing end alpha-L-arabinofuranosidase [Medicago truncatula]|uniref:non-reducing end alpha-L-arabinofuranosidase n=1 Tax=Medicago truncatula TaxID=3880 RepID=G7L4R6_MEDTR|nr:alpha-L-arabinofuranosidase 1 [Medicago truncatula]AES81080.2 alpha-L-arabinofuranosidase-like protein [Medicago truncatula]RHN47644.1 putative non-reducing end alpha-L-arabinofuranosidase [Medicago truncatula]
MVFSKSCCSFFRLCLIIVSFVAFQCNADGNQTSTLVVNAGSAGRPIPNTLFGISLEEVNRAGTGGIWSELVSNRGFEAGGTQVPSNFDPWAIVGTEADIHVVTELSSSFERNKVALRIDVLCDNCPVDGVGISNPGFKGMNIVQGKQYKVALNYRSSGPQDMTISFRDAKSGGILGSSQIIKRNKKVAKWKKMETIITASASSSNASLTLRTTKKGTIWLDQVSAMPQDTYKGHGFRSDLVEMIMQLKPAFFRFPGGNFLRGGALMNAFRWKDTVGPQEQRPGHFNDVWNYWTDEGFGYYEGLQLAEDIGATPVWVINNGLSETDSVDTSAISPFVQEALDSIEFARGPSTSKWGAIRASMGHPEPFVLKYIALGSNNCGMKNYLGNYLAFHKAIRQSYPDIQIISNCDAHEKPLDHPADLYEYKNYPKDDARAMFNLGVNFDKSPRNGPKAFVSEYALIGDKQAKFGTILAGVAEAGFLIGLERNSDHVAMASYAPLLVNANDRNWSPDAIVFDSDQSYGTPSYWTQVLFKESNGATFINSQLQTPDPGMLAASAILCKNPQNNDTHLKIKIANLGNNQVNLKISLQGYVSKNLAGSTKTVLASQNILDENSFTEPKKIAPQQSPLQNPGNEMNVIIPPISLTVLDIF